jgi:transcriptional regulator with XRE-family HTH domain
MSPSRPEIATAETFNETHRRRFGRNIRRARKHLGLTQDELAARITRFYADAGEPARVTQSNVSRWEKGQHVPLKHLAALLYVLGQDAAYFVTDHDSSGA